MKLGFSTWFYDLPIEESVRRIAKFGYDGVEISIKSLPTEVDSEKIRRCIETNQLELTSIATGSL